MIGRIQHPVYTAAALTAANPVLLDGEVVYESDTRRHKIGDGVTAWNALPYAGGGNFEGTIPANRVTEDTLHRFVSDYEKASWNGKASSNLGNVTLSKSLSESGYYKAPDGLMFQWGYMSGASSGSSTAYFPTSFATEAYMVIAVPTSTETGYTGSISCFITAKKTSYFKVILNWKDGTGQGRSGWPFYWLALGPWK